LQSMPEVEYCNWADSPSSVFKLAQEKDYNLFLIKLDHHDMKVNLELIHDLRESISSSASCIVALKQSFTRIEERDLKSLGFDACLTNPPEKSQLKLLIDEHFNPHGAQVAGFPVLVQRSTSTT
jgi:CheY-like chemotaxis protein